MSQQTSNHSLFYSRAQLYDIAFGFKDVASENGTLVSLYHQLQGRRPTSFLDICAGPASNAIEMHQSYSIDVFALDASEEMVAYGRKKAASKGAPLHYRVGDMRSFELPAPVDVAAIFMASTGYLITNADMIGHLQAVARNLTPGGIYVLEMTHPRDVFGVGCSTGQEWEVTQDACTVKVKWGEPQDLFDPIREVREVTVRMTHSSPTDAGELVDRCFQRQFSYQEMRALVELSGVFEWAGELGSWNCEVPFSNSKEAWRMIPVLKKRHKTFPSC